MEINIDQDDGALEKWNQRHFRDSPVQVVATKRDEASGFANSFTVLMQNNLSLSFAMSASEKELRKAEQERQRLLEEQADKGKTATADPTQ